LSSRIQLTFRGSGDGMATKTVARPEANPRKGLSRSQAAAKIATLVEEYMTECRLTEKQKNERVAKFGKRVDKAIARRATR